MKEHFAVYILASLHNRVLYIVMTSDLPARIWEHKQSLLGFTAKYNVNRLVFYYESHESAESAIKRERNMKEWQRDWKIALIEKENPDWEDLYEKISGVI